MGRATVHITGDISISGSKALVLRLGSDGTVEWRRTYGGGRGDGVHSIQQTGDAGYIVAGYTRSFGADWEDILVLKLNPDGSIHNSCDFVGDTSVSEEGGDATVNDTSATVKDSSARAQDIKLVVRAPNCLAKILCP